MFNIYVKTALEIHDIEILKAHNGIHYTHQLMDCEINTCNFRYFKPISGRKRVRGFDGKNVCAKMKGSKFLKMIYTLKMMLPH